MALGGQSNLTPTLDSQEDIYNAIFSLLDQAVANFTEAKSGRESHIGSQDMLYGNDNSKWLAFAYALKARYKLHTQLRNPNAVAEALEAAEAAKAAGFDGAELDVFDDSNNNPWTAFFWNREYTASSKTVADLMTQRNDPRRAVYVYDFFKSTEVGTPGDQTAPTRWRRLPPHRGSTMAVPRSICSASRSSTSFFPSARPASGRTPATTS